MCRTNNVADVKLQHLRSEEDSLGLCVPTSKTDKFGQRANMFWHIYANPEDVKQCTLTALAAFMSLDELHPESDDRIFVGGSQDDRFANDMETALATEEARRILIEMGRAPNSISPHSTRKGAATYASSGTTTPPSYTSISLRAGWSVGHIQQRYIGPGDAMDTFLGRVLAGLDPSSPQFALLPPHVGSNTVADGVFFRCFPGFQKREGTSVIGVLRRILPSLLYHRRTLLEMLPPKHPLRSTVLFSDPALRQLIEKQLVTGLESEYMKALGIPLQVGILRELRPPEPAKQLPISPPRPHVQRTASGFPVNFEFPLVGGRAAWRLLVRGNRSEGIPPFRLLQPSEFSKNRDLGRRTADWRYFYQRVVDAIGQELMDDETLQRLEHADDEGELNRLFDQAWAAFGFADNPQGPGKPNARVQDRKLNTLVQKLRCQGKAQRGDDARPKISKPKPKKKTTEEEEDDENTPPIDDPMNIVVPLEAGDRDFHLFQQPRKKSETANELLNPKRRALTAGMSDRGDGAKTQRLDDGSRKKSAKVDYTSFL
jgi:hypothetical protein